MRARALVAALLLALAPSGPTLAQDDPAIGQVRSPVLTIDVDRLLAETAYGRRLATDLGAREEALAAENRRIEAELTAEERSLTERRPSMEVDAFRAEAEAFDAKVQRIRAEQDAKEQALAASVEAWRTEFLNAATPVLARLMIDSGAAVILERRNVFLSAGLVDITDEAIAAIDAQLGDGRAEEGAPEAPGDGAPAEAAPEPAAEPADGNPAVAPGTGDGG